MGQPLLVPALRTVTPPPAADHPVSVGCSAEAARTVAGGGGAAVFNGKGDELARPGAQGLGHAGDIGRRGDLGGEEEEAATQQRPSGTERDDLQRADACK